MDTPIRLLGCLSLTLLVSACAASRPAAPPISAPPSPLVLAAAQPGGRGMELQTIDPLTLGDVPEREPISLDGNGPLLHALSGDSRWLAVMQVPGIPGPLDGELLVIDLAHWQATRATFPLSSFVSTLTFGADDALYWLLDRGPPGNILHRDILKLVSALPSVNLARPYLEGAEAAHFM